MSAIKMEVQNSDYDAAQALLDLQGDKPENSDPCVWNGNDYRNMEKAAKLFWNCFISSEIPNNSNTNLLDSNSKKTSTHYGYKNSIPPRTSKENKNNSLLYPNSDQKISKKMIESQNNIVTPQMVSNVDKLKRNNSNHNSINTCKVYSKAKVRTREVGTQTEERYFNPNIEVMETTIQNLYERIKSLEAQLKEPDESAEHLEFLSSENENYVNDDISDASCEFDTSSTKKQKVNQSNASQYSEYSHKSSFDQSDYNRKSTSTNSRNNSYHDRVLVNLNSYKNANDMVAIGDGHAMVPSRILKHINWNSYTSATRKLLTAVFSRRILATHSLTGKPSPAFPNKPAKKKLDPALVNDIVQTVVERCSVPENVVRTSITTKCADESKMFRTRQRNSNKSSSKKDRENISPATSDSELDKY